MAKKVLIPAVKSLAELQMKVRTDPKYRALLLAGSENLGWDGEGDLEGAYQWLLTNAAETTEEGVVDEVNFCRDMI